MKKAIALFLLLALGGIIVFGLNYESAEPDDLSPEMFQSRFDHQPGVVIDVRTPEEFEEGHLSMTDYNYNFLSGEFEEVLNQLDKGETYYLYCRSGNRSGQALEIMKAEGFDHVYNIGGFEELVSSGIPANQ
jgi:phage shock protein E